MKPLIIYVSGPYTYGDRTDNVRNAIIAGKDLMAKGHHPYIPHLSFFIDLLFPHSWDRWLDLDIAILDRCDALIRLPGISRGADKEVLYARTKGITIFTELKEVPIASN